MFAISYLKKKFKKNETRSKVSDQNLAKVTPERNSAEACIEPGICVASDAILFHDEKEPINITLVKGSSDSKPQIKPVAQPRQFGSIKRDLKLYPTLEPEITRVQYVQAPPNAEKSTLYPTLDPIQSPGRSISVEPKLVKAKELEAIDIAKELGLTIQPRILYAAAIDKQFDQLKGDVQKEVLTVKKMIKNPLKYEYSFKNELEVSKNYSYVKVYQKLHSFASVRKCHLSNKTIKSKGLNSKTSNPVFQSYRTSFRCYKGQKSDVIDCD